MIFCMPVPEKEKKRGHFNLCKTDRSLHTYPGYQRTFSHRMQRNATVSLCHYKDMTKKLCMKSLWHPRYCPDIKMKNNLRSGPILAVLSHTFSVMATAKIGSEFVSPCPPECCYQAKRKLSLI